MPNRKDRTRARNPAGKDLRRAKVNLGFRTSLQRRENLPFFILDERDIVRVSRSAGKVTSGCPRLRVGAAFGTGMITSRLCDPTA
jgi:hypothetical protein